MVENTSMNAARYVGESYILRARARQHAWVGSQPLSIKAFFHGEAFYRVSGGHRAVGGASYLVLNAGQRYSISIEAAQPVESFCVFFSPELVADARRSVIRDTASLLDDPLCDQTEGAFYERVYPADEHVWPALLRLRGGDARARRGRRAVA